ncbi:MAG: hypothetical protein QOJ72_2432 [Nocardioidaceae bacterium]|nr:hypothetical protein [Nocardioidaceae bacterium]
MAGDFTERVHELVESIPPGLVLTYGDVAEVLEQGIALAVGRAMARGDDGVPWWRVVRSDGTLVPCLTERALPHWLEEGTAMRTPQRVDLSAARWEGPFPP